MEQIKLSQTTLDMIAEGAGMTIEELQEMPICEMHKKWEREGGLRTIDNIDIENRLDELEEKSKKLKKEIEDLIS